MRRVDGGFFLIFVLQFCSLLPLEHLSLRRNQDSYRIHSKRFVRALPQPNKLQGGTVMRGTHKYFLIPFRLKMVTLWRAFPVFLALLLISVPANADRVIPSSRVTSHLNVRQQPNVNSATVGILRPNESAELVERVPYWYHVRLNDRC